MVDNSNLENNDPLFLHLSPEKIKGMGLNTAKILSRMGIKSIRDLIEHYPYRYEDYSRHQKINQLHPDRPVTLKARVLSLQSRRAIKNKRMTIIEAILADDTGSISAVWFNQPYLTNVLQKGKEYYFYGTPALRGRLQLPSPAFEESLGAAESGKIIPVYSLPEGIAPKRYRNILTEILANADLADPLPSEIKSKYKFLSRAEALRQIHFPENFEKLERAKKRLAFDELFAFELSILYRRELRKQKNAKPVPFEQQKIKAFVEKLPFALTSSQKKSAWQIIQDLEKPTPMNRLLQGDVGSGKTVVAGLAAYSVSLAGGQTAILSPTEILAQQHYQTLHDLLAPENIVVALLSGSTPKKEKNEIYKALKNGKIKVIVGTHALLQEKVVFKNLNLLVVDEQHRFGVEQRAGLLITNGQTAPHLLSMTATPIPRTLALTLYGDLAISAITELPPGRPKVTTEIIFPNERPKAYAIVSKEILAGRQAFVICPLVEESDVWEVKSATLEKERLQKEVFPNFSVALIHGRLRGQEKDKIMREFKDGQYHILVSTSVIEVGIDVPNATVMLIEGAQRFGLSQLHQFRGRVGRGQHPSYCLLLPSGNNIPERLQAICKYRDGFKLAELDLQFRGMGQLTGTQQSGFEDFKIADPGDLAAVKLARSEAENIINQGLENYPDLKKLVEQKKILHAE